MSHQFRLCNWQWLFVIVCMAFISCGTSKKAQREVLLLQGNLDTLPNFDVLAKEPLIQKGDILSITVYSDNTEASTLFNQPQVAAGGSTGAGYLVNQQGSIHFQSLGLLQVEGLTKQRLIQILTDKLTVYLKNPYVDIRFLNFRIAVFGEIAKPDVYIIPQEKLTILELLAMAGDLTIYGKRDNVLIIREENGKRIFGRLDLRSPQIFQSPYYYLQQNDVVLVEPSRKKPSASEQTTLRNISLAATIVSTLAILITLIRN